MQDEVTSLTPTAQFLAAALYEEGFVPWLGVSLIS